MSIEVHGLCKRFGTYVAVHELNIEIATGEFFVLLGPSGCGKTTTLRMIAGLDTPSEGIVRIHSRNVTYAEPRDRDIAMVFQDYGLYPNMTVYKNIEFPLKVRKMAPAERRRKIMNVAERLGISEFLDRKPGKISGGQRQRVSLARALVRNPHAFLMDEPLSNLDAQLRAIMRTEIKQLVANLGITTVYVTHDQVEAMSMADRIGIMNKGNMIQIGHPLQVYDSPRSKFVAEFIGSPPMNLFRAEAREGSAIGCNPQPFADLLSDEERERAQGLVRVGLPFFIGIRPEHLALVAVGTDAMVQARVEVVEPLGQTTNVYLRHGSVNFVVATGRTAVRVGDSVGVVADPAHLRVVEPDAPRAA
jgi:multiple sugar transport system ATP-binding protein